MAYSSRSYARPYLGVPGLPPAIKWLLIVNIGSFLLRWILGSSSAVGQLFSLLVLVPQQVAHLYIWQLATYSFLHVDLWEILWNMLTLWMFGADLELSWGTDRFLRFYFLCTIGPAIVIVLLCYLAGIPSTGVIGAYAPIFGILMVCTVLWPDREVLFIIFPMKMKYFTILVGAVDMIIWSAGGRLIVLLGLMSGALLGYLMLKSKASARRAARIDLTGSLQRAYRDWKLARAKKKFQVYLRKQRPDRDIN